MVTKVQEKDPKEMGKGEPTFDPTSPKDAIKENKTEEDHIDLGSESEGDSNAGET